MSFAARAVAGVLSLCAVAGPSLAARAVAQDVPLAQLADRYRQGYRDDALDTVGLWTGERMRREVDGLLQLRPFDPALALTAALLHAHRALLGSSTTLECGQNLVAARRLLLAAADVPEPPPRADIARRVFLLVGSALLESLDFVAAHDVARAGLERFEKDPELLAVLGIALEAGPSTRTYAPPPDPRRPTSVDRLDFDSRPGFTVEGAGSRGEWRAFPPSSLGQAEAAFVGALAADPGLAEARVRLGHVRLLRGRVAEALVELQRVAREDGSPRRLYLASLFEGRAHGKRGDLESAVRAYRAAVAAEPAGQSAWIGLGRALDLLGRGEEAQHAFAAALGTTKERNDPWWSYARGDLDRLELLVAEIQTLLAR